MLGVPGSDSENSQPMVETNISEAEIEAQNLLRDPAKLERYLQIFWQQPDFIHQLQAIEDAAQTDQPENNKLKPFQLSELAQRIIQELRRETPKRQAVFEQAAEQWKKFVADEKVLPIMLGRQNGRQLLAQLNTLVENQITLRQVSDQPFSNTKKDEIVLQANSLCRDFAISDNEIIGEISSKLSKLVERIWQAPPDRYTATQKVEIPIPSASILTGRVPELVPAVPTSVDISPQEQLAIAQQLREQPSLEALINYLQSADLGERKLVFSANNKISLHKIAEFIRTGVQNQPDAIRDIKAADSLTPALHNYFNVVGIRADFNLGLHEAIFAAVRREPPAPVETAESLADSALTYEQLVENVKDLSLPDFISWLQAHPDTTVLGNRDNDMGNVTQSITLRELTYPLLQVRNSQNLDQALTAFAHFPFVPGMMGKVAEFIQEKYPHALEEAGK